jgi:Flp pilus assembly protein TadD
MRSPETCRRHAETAGRRGVSVALLFGVREPDTDFREKIRSVWASGKRKGVSGFLDRQRGARYTPVAPGCKRLREDPGAHLMGRPSKSVALAALVAASCGGQWEAERTPGRVDAAPLMAVVTQSSNAGMTELRSGNLAGARSAFELALGADPNQVAALNDLAVAYYLEERFDAARQLLDEVVARGGAREQQAALVNLGELCALDGYVSAAQAHLASARGLDPTRPEPLYALSLLSDARGDGASARAQLKEALRLDEGGRARQGLAFAYPEERLHLEALLAELVGDREEASVRWREIETGRFAVLAAAARRHLGGP